MTANSPFATATLAPMLSVRNGPQALAFYQTAFNATLLQVFGDPTDPGAHIVAELAVGKTRFWIADESPSHLNFAPDTLNGTTVRLILIVPDPDAAFAQAVTAGATIIHPVADQEYGWRQGRLVDPYGHHWEIGKPLSSPK